jgi:hypothetical protein
MKEMANYKLIIERRSLIMEISLFNKFAVNYISIMGGTVNTCIFNSSFWGGRADHVLPPHSNHTIFNSSFLSETLSIYGSLMKLELKFFRIN